ncbi:hypothetical protein V2J09_000069 [Rumex salicifolius]
MAEISLKGKNISNDEAYAALDTLRQGSSVTEYAVSDEHDDKLKVADVDKKLKTTDVDKQINKLNGTRSE